MAVCSVTETELVKLPPLGVIVGVATAANVFVVTVIALLCFTEVKVSLTR